MFVIRAPREMGWDVKNHPMGYTFFKLSHGMGWQISKRDPIPWDGTEKFFRPMGWDDFQKFLVPSHPIPWNYMLVKYRLKTEFYAQRWVRLILSILLLIHITNITIDSIVFFLCILIHSYRSYRQGLQWKSKTKYFLTLYLYKQCVCVHFVFDSKVHQSVQKPSFLQCRR